MLMSILLIFVVFHATAKATTMVTTTIYVEPQLTIIRPKEDNFFVNINIANVIDLCGWDFKLYYSNLVLNGTSITEGSFLKTGGNTYFVANFTDAYNATHGLIRAVCTLFEPTGVNGGGDLAKISFKAKGTGETSLTLADTKIVDSAFPPNKIPHAVNDGLVWVPKLGDLGGSIPPRFFAFDGEVDSKDLTLFLLCYKGLAPSEARYLGDLGSGLPPRFFNFDGVCNSNDLALFLLCYKGLGP